MSDNGFQNGEPAPARALGRNVRHLGGDVLTLLELQAELLQVDLREWASSFVKPIVALVLALVVMLASLPVLLVALGFFISEQTEFGEGASMLIAAGVGLLVAAVCAGLAIMWLKRDKPALHRFSAELKKNVSWLKQVLTSPSKVAVEDPRRRVAL